MATARGKRGRNDERESRDFTDDDALFKLAFLDMKHDFTAAITVDRAHKSRAVEGYNYFSGYITTIVRKVMGLNPIYSYLFNGCDYGYGDPEDFGLEQAKRMMEPTVKQVAFTTATASDSYSAAADQLDTFRAYSGKIPLVIDFQYQILHHNTYDGFTRNFIICRNREQYSDPSRTSKLGFAPVNVAEEIDGQPSRVYQTNETAIQSPVTVGGPPTACTIQYGDAWNETYSVASRILPNAIGLCKFTLKELIKQHTSPSQFKRDIPEPSFCEAFKEDNEHQYVIKSYPANTVLARIASQLIKKRLADQLQAASCKREIQYMYNGRSITLGGAAKPCVFWSHDRLAIAYAILNGIPCVKEDKNGTMTIYLPSEKGRGKRSRGQKGGAACTRAQLSTKVAAMGHNSDALVASLNADDETNCKGMLLTTVLTYKDGEDVNNYFDFEVLSRYIQFSLGHEWRGFPDDFNRIQYTPDRRAYVTPQDARRLGANTIYVHGDYTIERYGDSKYRLTHKGDEQATVYISGGDEHAAPHAMFAGGGGRGGGDRALIREFATAVAETERLFTLFTDNGEQFIGAREAEYHAREFYFFLQVLFYVGVQYCKGGYISQFADILRYIPSVLKLLKRDGLQEQLRFYFNTFFTYTFLDTDSIPTAAVETIHRILDASITAAAGRTKAPFGGLAKGATAMLDTLEGGMKLEENPVQAARTNLLTGSSVKGIRRATVAAAAGGARRRTRRRRA